MNNRPTIVRDSIASKTRNAVAKHELIEIIRTTKDRVPLHDALLTDEERFLSEGNCEAARIRLKFLKSMAPDGEVTQTEYRGGN